MSSSLSAVDELRMVLLASCQMNKNMRAFVMNWIYSIVKQTKAQINIVTIYNSPPQISINTVFFFCLVSLCMIFFFFLTYFIFVHNFFFFSCFQRREQCWTEDGVKILCPKLAEIKSLEHDCECVLHRSENHAITTVILLFDLKEQLGPVT